MKIAFVTGCLELGRDGVGDYVRTLARECHRRGHSVALVALAEPQAGAAGGAEEFAALRLTEDEAGRDGGRRAREWLDRFSPDWASLHFVPYSYDPRGLFAGKIPLLERVLGGSPHRQIFFHEVWIGSAVGVSFKERVTGWIQRRAVGTLLRRLRPSVVHTSVGYYRAALATVGCHARLLPMFGSVPAPRERVAPTVLREVPSDALVCGMFGALHPNWESEPFLDDFAALAGRLGRPAVLAPAGALRHGTAVFNDLMRRWRGRVTCVALGEQPVERLAGIFARFDFAVTASPWNLIGKSSSAAALREHRLGVVVTNAGTPPRFATVPAELEPADAGFVPYFRDRQRLTVVPARTEPRPGVARAADQMLADLQGVEGA